MIENLVEPKNTTILGSKKDIEKTTENISRYLAYELKDQKIENESKIGFVSKPLVIETNSRQEIEAEKKRKEAEEARALAYANYNYTNYNSDYSRNIITRESYRDLSSESLNNANSYYYGYCTWYVANKKNVPGLWGNAGQWLSNAQNNGYETSNEAKSDSIIVTNESGWGHVGVVESVNENTITISEMNYAGWGVVNTREIPKDSAVIKGYIY